MGTETESAIDYYVLFQDLSKHARRLKHSGESELQVGKEDSAVQFLWCYIGKLTARQARGVKIKLDLEFKTKFEKACPWYMDLNESLIKEVKESQFQMLQEKGLVARSQQGTEHFVVSKTKAIAPIIWRSFVQLLPLPTLTDMWHRVGCPTDVEPLRCTAVVWCRETFWKEKISPVGQKMRPGEVELVFKSSLDDQEMTVSQREVLWKCVDTANRVRRADGGGKDTDIKKNKYRLVQENTAAAPPMLEGQPSIIIDENLIEQIEVPMDEPGVAPPIFSAASGKPTRSIPLADEPNEVWVANEEPIAVRDDGVVKAIEKTNELLAKQNSLIEKGTAVNKKGFASLKPIDVRSLTELIKTLPPPAAGEDENWLSVQTVAQSTGESLDNRPVRQRQFGEIGKIGIVRFAEFMV